MKRKNAKRKAAVAAVAIVGVLAVLYVGGAIFFRSHYLPRTVINGIPCAGKNVQAVEGKIQDEIKKYELKIVEREDKSEAILGKDVGVSVEFDGTLQWILNGQNGFLWPVALFTPEVYESKSIIHYEEDALKEAMNQLSCMDPANMDAPVDAAVEQDGQKGYVIVPESEGTTVKKKAFWQALNDAVLNLQDELVMEEEKCYVEPKLRKDSKDLNDLLEQMNALWDTEITYQFGEKTEVLDGKQICGWMGIAGTEATLDEEQALAFVKELASKYNTAYKPKTLKTSWGETVTITAGNYGWRIDNEQELAQLLADIQARKDVTREPIYSQTANSHGENDYGDTYVEINLTAQHLYFYKDGNLVVDSDFVSGNVSKGNGTPPGAYPITYKQRDATLRGENYASDVSFWMPYCGNVGMHDASWRHSFGGSIYKRSGSHGCVNLPYDVAKKIYENVEAGDPVLVYELEGTQSAKAVAMDQGGAVADAINRIGEVNLGSGEIIASCRAQYDALSADAKSYVSNYDTLVAAETAYAGLMAQEAENQANAEAQAQANAVVDLINQIGEVTEESGDAIHQARAAYDALSDRAKGFVGNYDTLRKAEKKFQSL